MRIFIKILVISLFFFSINFLTINKSSHILAKDSKSSSGSDDKGSSKSDDKGSSKSDDEDKLKDNVKKEGNGITKFLKRIFSSKK